MFPTCLDSQPHIWRYFLRLIRLPSLAINHYPISAYTPFTFSSSHLIASISTFDHFRHSPFPDSDSEKPGQTCQLMYCYTGCHRQQHSTTSYNICITNVLKHLYGKCYLGRLSLDSSRIYRGSLSLPESLRSSLLCRCWSDIWRVFMGCGWMYVCWESMTLTCGKRWISSGNFSPPALPFRLVTSQFDASVISVYLLHSRKHLSFFSTCISYFILLFCIVSSYHCYHRHVIAVLLIAAIELLSSFLYKWLRLLIALLLFFENLTAFPITRIKSWAAPELVLNGFSLLQLCLYKYGWKTFPWHWHWHSGGFNQFQVQVDPLMALFWYVFIKPDVVTVIDSESFAIIMPSNWCHRHLLLSLAFICA